VAGPVRVVIVDDAPRTLDNLKKLLAFEPDVEVAGTALSAQAGLEEARRLHPDLILMDVNLPDLDGISATEVLTAEMPGIPIVIISVQDDREYLRRAMQAGAREYLVKPFSADELIAAIRRVSQVEARKREQAARAPAAAPPAPPAPAPPAPPQGADPQILGVTTQLSRNEIAAAIAARQVAAPPPVPSAPPPAPVAAVPPPPVAPTAPAPVAAPPAPVAAAPPVAPPVPEAPAPPEPAPPPAVVAAPPAPVAPPEPAPPPVAPPPAVVVAPPAPVAPPEPVAPPAPVVVAPAAPLEAPPAPEAAPPAPPLVPRRNGNGVLTLLFSGKGGVGKSVLAINVAAQLAKETHLDVALVDLNLQFGDLEVLLGLDSAGSVADVARAYPNVDAPFLGSLMPEAAGVRVLAGPRSPELADLIHAEHIKITLDLLRQTFDHVVIDCQTHLDDRTLEALEAADNIILITDLNIPSIKDAKLAFKLFETLHVSRERIILVLNRSNAPSNVNVAQLEANLRCPVSVQIPSEGKLVLASIQKAAPFVLMYPDAQISQKVREVVGCLVPLPGAAEPRAKGQAGRRKLFGRVS
jgi:DNA-binding NarL/FixJ family response regulator/MinD-like ATPase involved in chromosome partitioning or flagellar assembly